MKFIIVAIALFGVILPEVNLLYEYIFNVESILFRIKMCMHHYYRL